LLLLERYVGDMPGFLLPAAGRGIRPVLQFGEALLVLGIEPAEKNAEKITCPHDKQRI
jgi:hypothetical protein